MKKLLLAALSALLLLCLNACKKEKPGDIPVPPPINRIDYVLVSEEQNELLIYGQFPDEKGAVSLDGVGKPLPIKTWSRALIVCSDTDNGIHDFGDVVVQSGDSKSAPRRLYKWDFFVTNTRPHGGLSSDTYEEVYARFSIRGDAKPAPSKVFTEACRDLNRIGWAEFKAGGVANSSYDCGKIVAEWQKTEISVDLTHGMSDLSGKTHFQGYKIIKPNGFDLYLDFVAWQVIPMKLTTTSCGANPTIDQKKWSSQVLHFDGYKPINLTFDENRNIKSDSIKQKVYNSTQLIWNVEDGEKYARTSTLKWRSERLPKD